jgi:lipopolysaccharide export system permease protein
MAMTRVATLRGDLGRLAEDIARARKEENKYLVEIYKKYAIPAACLIFVFVGAPLGILVRRGNFGVSAVIALGFYVLYWSCLVVGEKLADRDILPPSVAMWLGDFVVGALGAYLMFIVSRESNILRINFSGIRRLIGKPGRRKGVV